MVNLVVDYNVAFHDSGSVRKGTVKVDLTGAILETMTAVELAEIVRGAYCGEYATGAYIAVLDDIVKHTENRTYDVAVRGSKTVLELDDSKMEWMTVDGSAYRLDKDIYETLVMTAIVRDLAISTDIEFEEVWLAVRELAKGTDVTNVYTPVVGLLDNDTLLVDLPNGYPAMIVREVYVNDFKSADLPSVLRFDLQNGYIDGRTTTIDREVDLGFEYTGSKAV